MDVAEIGLEGISSVPGAIPALAAEVLNKPIYKINGQRVTENDVKDIVDNRSKWNHKYMEDESMSLVVSALGIPFHAGKSCSINVTNNGYLCLGYGGKSLEYHQWDLLKPLEHFFFRVKQDGKRNLDKEIMSKLFENL